MMFLFYLILAFIGTIIVAMLLLRAGMVLMARRAGNFIGETHQHIEYITSTRQVPSIWTAPFVRQFDHVRQHTSENSHKLGRIRKAARKTCLKKLAKLITYTHNSLIIQDEETRQILLRDLAAILEEWENQEWDFI